MGLACLGLLLPQTTIMAAPPQSRWSAARPTTGIIDVALDPQGTLHGTVADPQGVPRGGALVVLLHGTRPVAATKTDTQGRFVFAGLIGGVYAVNSEGVVRVCRAWAPRTAPPSANQGLLMVSEGRLVRGKGPLKDSQGRLYTWISENYLLTWCAIAAAIAVPVAIIGSQQDEGPQS